VEKDASERQGFDLLRLVNERTAIKILVDGSGIMLSITTKKRAFSFFLARRYVGGKVAPTTDPFPGIVEVCGYDIRRILECWDDLYRIKIVTQAPAPQ
jgi:hypothetical protein